jgi:hypothetical protein
MLAARFEDCKLTLQEEDEFRKQLQALPWDSTDIDVFLQGATADVRKALATEDTKLQFLTAQCSRFPDAGSKKACLDSIKRVLEADGIDTKEGKLLQQIQDLLEL